jgi:hypothetical protein
MRLTLRTLLAYLDDILEPADAAAMAKKIEESEYATGLMHRTRDVTRRLRLGAPKLEGRGMGLDPNTVAEYLDNTLASERVPDFEKVCLESDVHLAEVASAHQILALVLGEPAEFDSRSRQRMYNLASAGPKAEPARTIEVRQENGKVVVETSKSGDQADKPSKSRKRKDKKRRRPEVPDYLRESAESGGRRRWLAGALAVLLLATGAAALAVRFAAPEAWRRWTGQAVAANTSTERDAASSDDHSSDDQASRASQAPDEDEAAESNAGDARRAAKASGAAAKASEASDEERASSDARPTKSAQAPDQNESDAAERPASDDPNGDAPIAPMPSDKPLRQAGSLRQAGRKPDAAADKPQDTAEGGKSEVARGEVLGRLISEHDIVLRWNDEQQAWQRVPGRASVFAGDILLALPTYQPSIALGAGVTLQLLGGAAVKLYAPNAEGVPGIDIIDGRVLLMTVAKPDVQLRVQAGGQRGPTGLAVFGRDDTTLAIQVERDLPDGADPETQPATVRDDLYLTTGEVQWLSGGAPPQRIKAPDHRALHEDPGARVDVEMPAWITSTDLAPIEKRAKAAIDEYLAPDRSANDALKELADDRRAERSLLAMKSLALIGEFEQFPEMLGKETQKDAWADEIESLRAALARGPSVASQIRGAFENKWGETKGAALYRMLWGYSPDQLEAGDAKRLVEYLSHDDLEFRVLGLWNLHQITGLFIAGYRPEWSEDKRRKGAAAWRQRLESGRIVPMAGGK